MREKKLLPINSYEKPTKQSEDELANVESIKVNIKKILESFYVMGLVADQRFPA